MRAMSAPASRPKVQGRIIGSARAWYQGLLTLRGARRWDEVCCWGRPASNCYHLNMPTGVINTGVQNIDSVLYRLLPVSN